MSIESAPVVLIIGGGLGGLALAQLLQQSSPAIEVRIFERDGNDQSRGQGYCIGLDSMGLDVLKEIRALDYLLSDQSGSFCSLSAFCMANRYLQKLVSFNAKGSRLIYREDLRHALLQNIDVQWSKQFTSYTILDDGVEANFADGTSVRGTILIGCDGAKSLVRAQLLPDFVRTDLRVINTGGTIEQYADMKKIEHLTRDNLVRVLGKQGHTLLILPFRQLWMWALSWPETGEHEEQTISTELLADKARRYFNDDEIVRLMERSAPSTYIGPFRVHSAECLKQNPFPNNPRVTLLGDAAHPMTTHAGKGANTAFADASDLAKVLHNLSPTALSGYEQAMFKRGYDAVQMSLSSTKMIHLSGWAAMLRDGIFSFIRYATALINVIAMPFRWRKNKHD